MCFSGNDMHYTGYNIVYYFYQNILCAKFKCILVQQIITECSVLGGQAMINNPVKCPAMGSTVMTLFWKRYSEHFSFMTLFRMAACSTQFLI
jgi:hypothetical protein